MSDTADRSAQSLPKGAILAIVAAFSLVACDRDTILPGERFDTSLPLSATLPDADGDIPARAMGEDTDVSRATSLPAVARLGDWPQRGFDATNRIPHGTLGAAPQQVWQANIGAGNTRRLRITADPVAADGRVFTLDASAGLTATALDSGGTLWRADLVPGFDRGGNVSGGGLAVSGGRIFATTGFGEIVALDAASGAVIWRQRLAAGLGTPTVSGGVVYVVSNNNQAWALSADAGRIEWERPAAGSTAILTGSAAPAVTSRLVIFPLGTGELLGSFLQSGVPLWTTSVAGGRDGVAYANINDITGDPVVVGGRIFAGNQSGRVIALDAQAGTRIWTSPEGSYSPLLHTGSDIFFISDRNELIRIDAANGERIWGTELPLYVQERERRRRAVFTHFGPILAGGRLVVASNDRQIRMFSPDSGELLQAIELRAGAAANPILVNDLLLVVTDDGRLTAYR